MGKASGAMKLLKTLGKKTVNLGAGATNLAARGIGGGVDLAKGGVKNVGKALNFADTKMMEPVSKKLTTLLGLPDAPKVLKNGKVAKVAKKGKNAARVKAFAKLKKEMPQVAQLIEMIRRNGSGIRKTGLGVGTAGMGMMGYNSLVNQPDNPEMM